MKSDVVSLNIKINAINRPSMGISTQPRLNFSNLSSFLSGHSINNSVIGKSKYSPCLNSPKWLKRPMYSNTSPMLSDLKITSQDIQKEK